MTIRIVEQATGQANVDWINRDTARAEFDTPPPPRQKNAKAAESKGDTTGHAFHGNRFTGGIGGGASVPTGRELAKLVRESTGGFDKTVHRVLDTYSHIEDTKARTLKGDVVSKLAPKLNATAAYRLTNEAFGRANMIIGAWAKSSTDTRPDSIALQLAAAEKFGIRPGAFLDGRAQYMSGGFRDILAAGPPAPRTDVDAEGRLLMGKDDIEGTTDPEYNAKWNASYKAFAEAVEMSINFDKTTTFVVPKEYAVETTINHGYGDYPVRPYPGYGTHLYTQSEGYSYEKLPNGDERFTRDNTKWGAGPGGSKYGQDAPFEAQPIPWDQRMADARIAVDAIYESTQEALAASDIKELTVFRGMHFGFEGDPPPPSEVAEILPKFDPAMEALLGHGSNPEFSTHPVPNEITIDLNPLSSFSVNTASAEDFATGDRGIITAVTVPADRVFSLPSTGIGCLGEGEVVVVGGPARLKAAPIALGHVGEWGTAGSEPAHRMQQSRFNKQ